MEDNVRVRLAVEGMTCTDCEEHVQAALRGAGATSISANFRRGEATFELNDDRLIDVAKRAVADTGYEPGKTEILNGKSNNPDLNSGHFDYDFLIIGSGGAAFSAAIQAVSYGARVAMVERVRSIIWQHRIPSRG